LSSNLSCMGPLLEPVSSTAAFTDRGPVSTTPFEMDYRRKWDPRGKRYLPRYRTDSQIQKNWYSSAAAEASVRSTSFCLLFFYLFFCGVPGHAKEHGDCQTALAVWRCGANAQLPGTSTFP